MNRNDDLASLLADILDDSKPLPLAQALREDGLPKAAAAVEQLAAQRESNPVDEFMQEYLGETEQQITQLCEKVQAGPGADYTKPTAPCDECGSEIPLDASSMVNGHHSESCSLYDAPPQVAKPPSPLHTAVDTAYAAALMGANAQQSSEILLREVNAAEPEVDTTVSTLPGQILNSFGSSDEEVARISFPKFEVKDFAAAADMRNFATLVTLNTSRWHAKVKDKKASESAARANDADPKAFETRKHLLGGANDKLKAVHRAIDEARAAHYEMTVPFTTTSIDDTGRRTGGRLLPNTLFDEYITIMARHQKAMKDALNEFIPEYPQMIEEAKSKLGNRFDPAEYPNADSIRHRFDLSFDFAPIPAGDDFKGLAATQLNALARKLNESLEQKVEYAMQDLWCRMHDVVSKMAERLSSPDKTFHNTLVQNVRDVARLAGHLNVIGDGKVEEIRKLMEEHLCQHEPKDLREKPLLRQQVAAHACDILERMSR